MTEKQKLLAYLAEHHNHIFVEKIVKENNDDALFSWLLDLIKQGDLIEKKLSVLCRDIGIL